MSPAKKMSTSPTTPSLGPPYDKIYDKKTNGKTTLIIGPMFSGKTSELFRLLRQAAMGQRSVCLIKYSGDTRYADGRATMASSHDGNRMRAIVVDSLVDDPPGLQDVIGVDEGQFMCGLADFCKRQNALGRDVVVAALNAKGDAQRSGWPHVLQSVSIAHDIQMMHATCTLCQSPHANCSRFIRGTPVLLDGSIIDVGANDKYIATCAGCYERPIPAGVIERRMAAVEYIKTLSL